MVVMIESSEKTLSTIKTNLPLIKGADEQLHSIARVTRTPEFVETVVAMDSLINRPEKGVLLRLTIGSTALNALHISFDSQEYPSAESVLVQPQERYDLTRRVDIATHTFGRDDLGDPHYGSEIYFSLPIIAETLEMGGSLDIVKTGSSSRG